MARKSNGKSNRVSTLARLGVLGLDDIEPAILVALIQEEPLLLVGPHGTGKAYLVEPARRSARSRTKALSVTVKAWVSGDIDDE